MTSKSSKKSGRSSRRGRGATRENNSLLWLADRTRALGDDEIVPLGDVTRGGYRFPRPPTSFGIPRNIRSKIYWFKQTYPNTTFSTSTSVSSALGISWNLGTLGNAASFTAIFDVYCIVAVVVRFLPDSGNLPNSNTGQVYSVIDYDNAANPTGIAYMSGYASCLVVESDKEFTRVLSPKASNEYYLGAYGTPANPQWIDCSFYTANHYGIKVYATTTHLATSYIVETDFYVAFAMSI